MADFEGSASLTQAVGAASATGSCVNPGGTQPVGTLIASGNVIYAATVAVAQPVASVSASGTAFDIAGTATLTQQAGSVASSGNTGPDVSAAIVQPAQRMSASGTVAVVSSPTGSAIAARAAVASRKDIQLPRIPPTADKETQQWMQAIRGVFDKYIFGTGDNRLVTVGDLVRGGIADRDGPGVSAPIGNVTVPSAVTNLRADGALASIIVQWKDPVFPNYGYTELWRASVDDLGQAVKIAETTVEVYTDMVGSGASKFYWARAVSDAGVKGDWSDSAAGSTGYDPTYVRDIMTSAVWKAVTPYAAYQYVRPTTPNGYQYACITGGRTGGIEPAWPTDVGDTVSDAGVTWQCVAADSRVPFVVGADPDGSPAVFIDTAYIETASITSAKIGDLVADKITTGDLNANLHVLSKLWAGFDEYANAGQDSGFWLGMDSGFPRLHLNTGLANGSRYIKFTGSDIEMNVDILSGADISADDLFADSATLTRASIDLLSVKSYVTPSDWLGEADPPITVDNPDFENYLCYATGCRKTESFKSARMIIGTGFSRPFAFFQTSPYTSIVPYDRADDTTKYRCKKKAIGMGIKVVAPGVNQAGNHFEGSYLDVYILNDDQSFSSTAYNGSPATSGVPSTYLAKMSIHSASGGEVQATQNLTGTPASTFTAAYRSTADGGIVIYIEDDGESLNYVDGTRLKIGVVYKGFYQAGGSDDDTIYGTISVDMQIDTIIQLDVADNDSALE